MIIRTRNRTSRRAVIKEMQREAARTAAAWPATLTEVPRDRWPEEHDENSLASVPRTRMWASRRFVVQMFVDQGVERLSVSRTAIDERGEFLGGITWDELQQVKRECGFGDRCAVEVYPRDVDVVNVNNVRHLWLVDIPFVWTDRDRDAKRDVEMMADPERSGGCSAATFPIAWWCRPQWLGGRCARPAPETCWWRTTTRRQRWCCARSSARSAAGWWNAA